MTGVDLGIDGYDDAVEIGRGGFGVVYRAHRPGLSRFEAIKILTVAVPGDTVARARFEEECRAMGTLSGHPNIVDIYDYGVTRAGHLYLTMAYMTGGSLASRLDRTGPLSWTEAAQIGVALSRALVAAHERGVLHRDIKPENVLLSDHGQPKLADFGLARLIQQEPRAGSALMLTPAHAAPEILAGEPASPASDIYSLGSTLFTLVAGAPAFVRPAESGLLALFSRVTTEPVPDLSGRGVPPGFCAIIERAMEKAPAQRYPSAGALAQDLESVLTGGSPERGRRSQLAAAAGVTVTDRGHAAGSDPARPSRSGRGRLVAAGLVVLLAAAGVVAFLLLGHSSGKPNPTALTSSHSPSATTSPSPSASVSASVSPSGSAIPPPP
ncbi:MAG: serine/threonine-protein kinase, partial [Mycobacteriales bacterium]